MRTLLIFAFSLLSASPFWSSAFAGSRFGEGCDLSVLGVQDDTGFMRFDNALREAVTSRNAAALAKLAQFPLRLNRPNGESVSVGNAAALQSRLGNAWPGLQKAVDAKPPGELFCNAEGVMYGDGEIWANPGSGAAAPFRISSMNLPEPHAAASDRPAARAIGPDGQVQLACSTDRFQIVIDEQANETSRYRSWNKPHAAPEDPAIELIGRANFEGTGACAHRVWDFRNGNADYVLGEPGCGDGSAPAKAKAQLEVLIGGKSQLKSWCY